MTSVNVGNLSPEFKNVEVTVYHGTAPGTYAVTCVPDMITVHSTDAVINYQITSLSPDGIQFSGMTVLPSDTDQLSIPSISTNGKMLTFNNANTEKITLNVTLQFFDKDGSPFSHDPQIQNDPNG